MTFDCQELEHQVGVIQAIAKKVFSEMGASITYKIGTMIEVPRACLIADEVKPIVIGLSFR